MRLALGQLLVEGGEPERNLLRSQEMTNAAVREGADLILFPEVLDFAWTHPAALCEAQPIPGPYSDFLCRVAREAHVWICAGLTEKRGERNHNTAILIDRSGNIALSYQKINLLDVEMPYYAVGKTLNVVDTEFGAIGLNVCADNYIDGLCIGHTLGRMGAQLILSPSSWTSTFSVVEDQDPYHDKWIKPYSILARLHGMIVAGATSVGYIVGGPYEGKKMVGCSLVVGPEGVLCQGRFNEFAGDLIIADIKLPTRSDLGTLLSRKMLSQGFRFDDSQWDRTNGFTASIAPSQAAALDWTSRADVRAAR